MTSMDLPPSNRASIPMHSLVGVHSVQADSGDSKTSVRHSVVRMREDKPISSKRFLAAHLAEVVARDQAHSHREAKTSNHPLMSVSSTLARGQHGT